MKIDRYNYPQQFGEDPEPLFSDIRSMILGGEYILTRHVAEFERAFADYIGVPHAAGLGSGTDALILALMAAGVGPGDGVITAANTFYATVAAIRLVGAVPELVDADEDTFLMHPDRLRETISTRTRAVIPVHLYGKINPMDRIMEIARACDLVVIEDAAQAHGASLKGKRAGAWGDIGCFSFHPSKNLAAAGDAGAVVTASPAYDEEIRIRRGLGQRGQNNHVLLGYNSKLDSIQARILLWKLPHLDAWNRRRREIAAAYRRRLGGLPIEFQSVEPGEEHAYHLFQIRVRERDRLLAHLQARGVDAVIRYPQPIHLQPAFADLPYRKGEFPVAEILARELLCLPLRPDFGESEIDHVVNAIREYY